AQLLVSVQDGLPGSRSIWLPRGQPGGDGQNAHADPGGARV
ncbi:MAG: hypothetical protein AVDCRST_MAG56-3849, partial [uncultured Cytophagales bacterium]